MKEHTKKGLNTNWSQKEAESRAKRSASSAPTPSELKNYRQLLQKALKGKKSPWVLVLGATPELRDLAIRLGATTVGVDISQYMLEAMNKVMKYKDSPKNLMAKVDWLKLDELFQESSFDVVLADASLNNVPPEGHDQVLKNVNLLLKPGGFFTTRNYVYLPDKPKDSFEQLQKKYNQGKLDWLWVTIHAGQYTKWQKKVYNPKTKKLIFGKVLDLFFELIKQKKFKMRKFDIEKLKNVEFHAHKAIHISFPIKEWNKMVEKYFVIKDRVSVRGREWTEFCPIWFLKKK